MPAVIASLALALCLAFPARGAAANPEAVNPEETVPAAAAPAAPSPAWPNGVLSAVRSWLADLGHCPPGGGTWDREAAKGLEQFRQGQGLKGGGPLNGTDLARLLTARFPAGCRLEISVRPAGPGLDPEAAASPPERKIALSAPGPEELLPRALEMLVPLAAPGQVAGENPEQTAPTPLARFQAERGLDPSGLADPATFWALLDAACARGCVFNLELKTAGSRTAPAQAKPAALELGARVKPESMEWRGDIKPGDQVLAVEKVECSKKSGDWVVFYQGVASQVEQGKVMVKLARRFGYRYRPEAAGVEPDDWWCVPRRRHCWSQVKFSDWGGKRAPDQIVEFKPQAVFSGRIGVVNAMNSVVGAGCPR